MIIICAGDSYTEGMELWEEKYVPGYREIDRKSAFELSNSFDNEYYTTVFEWDKYLTEQCHSLLSDDVDVKKLLDKISDERKLAGLHTLEEKRKQLHELTYSGVIQTILNCKMFNTGRNGSSQISSVQRAIIQIKKLQKLYPDEKIICILQNTFPNRIWIKDEKSEGNRNFLLSSFVGNTTLSDAEIITLYMKYVPDLLMDSEFKYQALSLQKYCVDNDIKFLCFNVASEDIVSELSLKHSLSYRLSRCRTNFILPCGHYDIESHKLTAYWLVEEMKDRRMI